MACSCQSKSINGTMATRKKRKQNKPGEVVKDVLAVSGGIAVGNFIFPKAVDMIDPNQNINPAIIKGAGTALGVIASMNTKGTVQKMAIGAAGGMALSLVGDLFGISGYSNYEPSTDVNRIAEGAPGSDVNSRQNPGTV